MRKIERIKNRVKLKTVKTTGFFEAGFVSGHNDLAQEILDVLNDNPNLSDFLETDEGHNLWDSHEVRLVLNQETVFILKMNHYVELDKLNLIKESEFTKQVDEYTVEDFLTIDGINYIFIKEKKDA